MYGLFGGILERMIYLAIVAAKNDLNEIWSQAGSELGTSLRCRVPRCCTSGMADNVLCESHWVKLRFGSLRASRESTMMILFRRPDSFQAVWQRWEINRGGFPWKNRNRLSDEPV